MPGQQYQMCSLHKTHFEQQAYGKGKKTLKINIHISVYTDSKNNQNFDDLNWHQTFNFFFVIYSLTKVERGQCVGTLPLLFVCSNFDVVHDQRNPATKHKHAVANDSGGVKTAGEGWDPLNGRLGPWHWLYKQGTLTFTLCTWYLLHSTLHNKNTYKHITIYSRQRRSEDSRGRVGSPEWLAWSMTLTLQTGYSDIHSMPLAFASQHTL